MIYRMFSYCFYLTNAKKSRSAIALHTKNLAIEIALVNGIETTVSIET